MKEEKIVLPDDELNSVSGGAASPGAVIVCKTAAPLYSSNPAGNNFRSTAGTAGTVPPNATVRLYEYGTKYCKVISDGKVGWVETASLAI